MRALLPIVSLLFAVAHAGPPPLQRVELVLNLNDGSLIHASPVIPTLEVNGSIAAPLALHWKAIQRIDMATAAAPSTIHFLNGDRLTASIATRQLEFESMLGRLEVPVSLIRSVEVSLMGGSMHNVALGRPVHGQDGASHGKGLAKHVTDGDPATHAKPPASQFDYRIDLQVGAEENCRIDEIRIHWGRFGDRFEGIREAGGEGWAPAAWPGEYVTSYTVECRLAGAEDWQLVHQHQGRPVDEQAEGVLIEKWPSEEPGCRSESITSLQGLQLERVAELRIRAQGGHWIGLHELEAFGWRE